MLYCQYCDHAGFLREKWYNKHMQNKHGVVQSVRRARSPLFPRGSAQSPERAGPLRFNRRHSQRRHTGSSHANVVLSGTESDPEISRGQQSDSYIINRRVKWQENDPSISNCNFTAGTLGKETVYKPKFYLHQISNLQTCAEANCVCCQQCIIAPTFSSNATGDTFLVTGATSQRQLPTVTVCKLANVIYLITCTAPGCGLQYVGSTASVKKPMEKRKTKSEKRGLFGIHFSDLSKQHLLENATFQIIEMIEGGDKGDKKGEVKKEKEKGKGKGKEKEMKKGILLSREDFWTRTLLTFYPLGLNDKLMKDAMVCTTAKTHPMYMGQGYGAIPVPRPTDSQEHEAYTETFPINGNMVRIKQLKGLGGKFVSNQFPVKFRDN